MALSKGKPKGAKKLGGLFGSFIATLLLGLGFLSIGQACLDLGKKNLKKNERMQKSLINSLIAEIKKFFS